MIRQSPILSLPENIEAPLWRYISIAKLESLLRTGALYFRRADLFEDPLEGKHSEPTGGEPRILDRIGASGLWGGYVHGCRVAMYCDGAR